MTKKNNLPETMHGMRRRRGPLGIGAACRLLPLRDPARSPQATRPLSKYSVAFTLIRDAEVDHLLRVFHGTANSKTVRLDTTNPGGRGRLSKRCAPESRSRAFGAQATPYTLETQPDQDIYC